MQTRVLSLCNYTRPCYVISGKPSGWMSSTLNTPDILKEFEQSKLYDQTKRQNDDDGVIGFLEADNYSIPTSNVLPSNDEIDQMLVEIFSSSHCKLDEVKAATTQLEHQRFVPQLDSNKQQSTRSQLEHDEQQYKKKRRQMQQKRHVSLWKKKRIRCYFCDKTYVQSYYKSHLLSHVVEDKLMIA